MFSTLWIYAYITSHLLDMTDIASKTFLYISNGYNKLSIHKFKYHSTDLYVRCYYCKILTAFEKTLKSMCVCSCN